MTKGVTATAIVSGEEQWRECKTIGAMPVRKVKSGKSTWGRTRMMANNASSRMRTAHRQRAIECNLP